MKKRRILSSLLIVSLAALSFTACGKKTTKNKDSKITTKDTTPAVESFKVDFNTNGGSNIDSIDVVKGNKVTKPADPTKTGYKFSGWFKDASLNTEFNFDEEIINEKTTIYAKWEADSVVIEFINNAETEVTGNVYDINTTFGEVFIAPSGENYYESINYTFVGWTTTNYTFGVDSPAVEYNAGVEIDTDNLTSIYKDGKIKFYAVFSKNEYTYKVTKVDSTLAKDGYIEYKCNEDPSKSYTEILKKEDIFYARPIDVSNIGNKVDIKVEIMQGSISDTDIITVGLKNDRIINDIQVVGLSKSGGYVSSATVGDIVDIIVTGSITASDVCLINGLVCQNNKAILNDELYLRVDLLDSSEGGRMAPFNIGYTPLLNITSNQVQKVEVTEIYYINYTVTTEAHPGQSYLLKVVVPDGFPYVFAWKGIEGTLKEGETESSIKNVGLFAVLGSDAEEFETVKIDIAMNDGSTNVKTFEADKDLTLSDLPKPYRSGYKFLGYYEQPICDDMELLEFFNEEETVAYHYTTGLYAIWEELEGLVASSVGVIPSRGTIMTQDSAITSTFTLNDRVLIYTENGILDSVITGISVNNTSVNAVSAGTTKVTLLLRGIERDQIQVGNTVVVKPIS